MYSIVRSWETSSPRRRHSTTSRSTIVVLVLLCALSGTSGLRSRAAFSGTNGKIAFAGPCGINVMNPDGTGRTALVPGSEPAFAASANAIAYTGGSNDVMVMNADGTGSTDLTSGPTTISDAIEPTFSACDELGFTGFPSGTGSDGIAEVYMIRTSGTGLTRLTDHVAANVDLDRQRASRRLSAIADERDGLGAELLDREAAGVGVENGQFQD